jgi:transcription elongation factor Elf1
MSVYIDRKFLLQVSPKLQRFVQKKTDLYNFRCPFCGDSTKNKIKARGFIFRKKNDYFYTCHNCSINHTFYNFLSFVEPTLLKEYSLDRYKDGESGSTFNYPQPKFQFDKPVFKQSIKLESVESLPTDHFAKQYVINRMIPKERWSELYFTPDFAEFVKSYDIDKGLKSGDPRLIIPFYDKDKNLFAFQGRALSESKLKYITVKLDEDAKKLYGLDKIDLSKRIYVVEGPIDSMFLDNCIATADATLAFASEVSENIVLVNDNEPRNKEIVKQITNNIKNGFNVVIWPDNLTEKDINDMIMNGMSKEQITTIIDEHTYSGLRAEFELNNWRKC